MSSKDISISVVLPIYIRKDKNIADSMMCIEALRSKTDIPFQLVIVETASQHFIDEADIYIYEREKTNPNNSVNRGFRACQGDYVVFVGNDVIVGDRWLESLLKCFEIKDCGIATLGNTEHKDQKRDEIIEKIYFSICMFRKEDAWLDPFYTYIFDDTDMVFRIYLSGRKCYKNLATIVKHDPHTTYGKFCGDPAEYTRSLNYFREKYKAHKNSALYKKLAAL